MTMGLICGGALTIETGAAGGPAIPRRYLEAAEPGGSGACFATWELLINVIVMNDRGRSTYFGNPVFTRRPQPNSHPTSKIVQCQ